MSNDDNGRKDYGPSSDNKDHNSIFHIMDSIMSELNKTRKIFMFMFFSMMILPVTAIIIFISTFDEPTVNRDELRANIQEFNVLSQKLKDQVSNLENAQPGGIQEQELLSILNSEDYKQTINRIDVLSESELKLINSEPTTYLYKKEIRLITFILSIIWIILGIRQYIVLSNWGKRYTKFKRQQEEIDKKLDSA